MMLLLCLKLYYISIVTIIISSSNIACISVFHVCITNIDVVSISMATIVIRILNISFPLYTVTDITYLLYISSCKPPCHILFIFL